MTDKLDAIDQRLEEEERPEVRQRLYLEREREQEKQFKASIARRAKLAKRSERPKAPKRNP